MHEADYQFDVFLSYRNLTYGDWVRDTFYDLFATYLYEELGRSPSIYFDKEKIETGVNWESDLKKALATSRCLVAIWSPTYFDSIWCRRELNMMCHREKIHGYFSSSNPRGLVLPVCVYDGDSFPNVAKKRQQLNCHKFAKVGSGFKRSVRYIKFQDELVKWIPDVATTIRHAPKWNSDWLSLDWIEDDTTKPPTLTFAPPAL